MCDADHAPSDALLRLYRAWADGGAGLMLTGNVMVDRRAMTGPGGVGLEDDRHLERFTQWAQVKYQLKRLSQDKTTKADISPSLKERRRRLGGFCVYAYFLPSWMVMQPLPTVQSL